MAGEAGCFPAGDLRTTALRPITGALSPDTVQSHVEATPTQGPARVTRLVSCRSHNEQRPLGGRSEPQMACGPGGHHPPHPPGGPVGSRHNLEAARVGLWLVLESDPHVWGLSVGPTVARVALTDQPRNPQLPTLEVPGPRAPHEFTTPRTLLRSVTAHPRPLGPYPTLRTSSSKERPPTSCLGPQTLPRPQKAVPAGRHQDREPGCAHNSVLTGAPEPMSSLLHPGSRHTARVTWGTREAAHVRARRAWYKSHAHTHRGCETSVSPGRSARRTRPEFHPLLHPSPQTPTG